MTFYFGTEAVAKVEEVIGRPLRAKERRVVWLEAFSDAVYRDSKQIETNGVGQTGEWLNRSFVDAFLHHELRVMNRIPEYRVMPEFLQGELMQAEYRGDLGVSPKACALINTKKYEMAADEFLDHAEYRSGPRQIRRRIEAVSTALKLYGLQLY